MTLFANKYRIESARKPGWDYAADGSYFVTICCKNKEHLLGTIIDGKMVLNKCGKIVEKSWHDLPNHYPNLILDSFVIMPNHVHGIMVIENDRIKNGHNCIDLNNCDNVKNFHVETGLRPVSTHTHTNTNTTTIHGIFEFIRAFKSFSSRKINEMEKTPGQTRWQLRFHDHIIRNDDELKRIRYYIKNNPAKWQEDSLF